MSEPVYIDVQAMEISHPEIYQSPSESELSLIDEDYLVKVCTVTDGILERFWAVVTAVDGDSVTANVNVDVIGGCAHGLRAGDEISVEKRHVCGVLSPEDAEKAK